MSYGRERYLLLLSHLVAPTSKPYTSRRLRGWPSYMFARYVLSPPEETIVLEKAKTDKYVKVFVAQPTNEPLGISLANR